MLCLATAAVTASVAAALCRVGRVEGFESGPPSRPGAPARRDSLERSYLADWRSAQDPTSTLARFAQAAVAEMERTAPDDPVTLRLVRWRDKLCGGSVRSCIRPMTPPVSTPGVTNAKRDIRMCADRGDGTIEELRDALFVLLHEMAHVATVQLQHVPEFWHNFQFLLKTLSDAGLYTPPSYEARPSSYCGTAITSSSFECSRDGSCPLGGV